MDFFKCMLLEEAKKLIINSMRKISIEKETILLTSALGRILAEDIISTENLPSFNRSTVDGFAVRSTDTFGSCENNPTLLSIFGEVTMGEQINLKIRPGQAIAIPTGGMLPNGADAVVMIENTEQPDTSILLIKKMVGPNENIIVEGEDIGVKTLILKKGQKIASQHIAILAAIGRYSVLVYKKINVAIISTGNELIDLNQSLQRGQIRDINSYALGAMLSEFGCNIKYMGIVKDNYNDFFAILQKAVINFQFVIISGGSSVGASDFTVKAISSMSKNGVLIHGIAIKPGKPTIFGVSDNGVPIFGLPGHPTAAMVVCEQLVKLAIFKLLKQKQIYIKYKIQAYLNRNIASIPGRDDFISVYLIKKGNINIATPILGKSGLISLMAKADGILHISANKSGVYNGDLVEISLINNR